METPRPEKNQIFSDTYKDIYFCEEDGLDEGDHVFLKGNRLPENWLDRPEFVIAETGFGTGLNFLATWLKWEATAKPGQHLTYISFEKFPLTPDQIRDALSRWKDQIGDKLEHMLDLYPLRVFGWHPIRVTDDISLILIFDDVNNAMPELDMTVDAWFLDGFAPAKNPEMWSETVFNAMAANSSEGTTIASFTAAGFVKRGLREVGFEIAKARGYGRKRDMIYGRFLSGARKEKRVVPKTVAVIGAGMAGLQAASALARENIHVDIYDANGIASGASGNMRGLFNPRFTAQRSPVSDFYASAFTCFQAQARRMGDIEFMPCGSVHLFTDADKEKRLHGTAENWNWHTDHMRVVYADEASDIAGVRIDQDCLYLPDAGFVSPQKLCAHLAGGLNVIQENITDIRKGDTGWHVGGKIYDAVILANGAGVLQFDPTKNLPLHTVRGQIAVAKPSEQSSLVKCNICYGGYMSPAQDGVHVVGSSFQPWLTHTEILEDDNKMIVEKLETAVPTLKGGITVTDARASLRCASKDRFPVIGAIPSHDNIYISAAHGSHGLISAAYGAQIIVAYILDRLVPAPKSVVKALSPARFGSSS